MTLNAPDGEPLRAKLGNRSGILRSNNDLNLEANGGTGVVLVVNPTTRVTFPEVSVEGALVRVASWSRPPAWDRDGRYDDNVFRGKIRVINQGGRLTLINELPIEQYLLGLSEAGNGIPPEAVKAIVVSARTYAYYYQESSHRKFGEAPYDGTDSGEDFQEYRGYTLESRNSTVRDAVKATLGEVITYSGSIIHPWYFAQSDGRTLSYREYCRSRQAAGAISASAACDDVPYLQSVSDPSGNLGRAGHGVGMSGAGARYLAEKRLFSYNDILTYFYSGVEVRRSAWVGDAEK